MEDIPILQISSFHPSVNSENVIQFHHLEDDTVKDDYVYDHDYIPHVKHLFEFARDVTVYIAGYVVMQLQKTIL